MIFVDHVLDMIFVDHVLGDPLSRVAVSQRNATTKARK